MTMCLLHSTFYRAGLHVDIVMPRLVLGGYLSPSFLYAHGFPIVCTLLFPTPYMCNSPPLLLSSLFVCHG